MVYRENPPCNEKCIAIKSWTSAERRGTGEWTRIEHGCMHGEYEVLSKCSARPSAYLDSAVGSAAVLVSLGLQSHRGTRRARGVERHRRRRVDERRAHDHIQHSVGSNVALRVHDRVRECAGADRKLRNNISRLVHRAVEEHRDLAGRLGARGVSRLRDGVGRDTRRARGIEGLVRRGRNRGRAGNCDRRGRA